MHYSGNCTPVTRGKNRGIRAEINLGPGEFVTGFEGAMDGRSMGQLQFTTNTGIMHKPCRVEVITFAREFTDSVTRMIGVTFGPYGEGRQGTYGARFASHAADHAPAHLAHSMGLLYFSGFAW